MLEAFTIQSLCLIVASKANDDFPWENPEIETSMRKTTTQKKQLSMSTDQEEATASLYETFKVVVELLMTAMHKWFTLFVQNVIYPFYKASSCCI